MGREIQEKHFFNTLSDTGYYQRIIGVVCVSHSVAGCNLSSYLNKTLFLVGNSNCFIIVVIAIKYEKKEISCKLKQILVRYYDEYRKTDSMNNMKVLKDNY